MTALHGFFGWPGDWDGILPPKTKLPDWIPMLASLPGEDSFALWDLAAVLNLRAPASDVLIGYSMGGRVALHMLIQDRPAHRWSKAVIVSASPGLSSPEERKVRLEHDRNWADRFRSEPLEVLRRDWNAQPVLAGEPEPPRREGAFSPFELAGVLLRGSVGAQDDLRPHLTSLTVPVLWIAGAMDSKYAALAEECANLNPLFGAKIIEGAGHRVPWSATAEFQRAINSFLENEKQP